MKLFTLLLLGFALSIALPARPANANDPETRTARRHFDKADKLFALGRFDEALEQYEKAFDAKPIPDFLFNIGQCYRNLGDYEAAIFSFRKFLT
ncbi:MAG TPA: tetratricopeptide repeat protein, partial [Kofleriaceae bacterium]|nr:tetratricopeptide repeat protein [Kofleriaceae bacterium]